MSKVKPNKQNNQENNFHNDPEVEKVIDIEIKTEQNAFNPEEFPDISSTVKMTNPGEEIKIHAENIVEVNAKKPVPEKKEEVKVKIINVAAISNKAEAKNAPKEEHKESKKVDIVDISKKKTENKHDNKVNIFAPLILTLNKLTGTNVVIDGKDLEKTLDSLIYLGGGVIAVTSLTSKALANLGNYLIKK